MTFTGFSELGLAEPILRALNAENYNTPTPIQAQAIPLLLAGQDLLGIAQTGTGKTAAFGLPLLQKLYESRGHLVPKAARSLILAPTRELALQISDSMKIYGRHLDLKIAVVFGGVGLQPQIKALARGVDVLIATPGRLLDLLNQRVLRLDHVGHLVLDEADRMLDMGFVKDVRKIVQALPRQRQSLLFSATMPDDVAKLAAFILHNPGRVEITPAATPVERIDQRVFFVESAAKRALLTKLMADPDYSRVIIFTRTKHGANRVAEHLEKAGISAEAIHGNKSQGARQRALESFRVGEARALVATDIMARGIDIDDVTHVINYELPNVPDSYVHRIGRTARAGTTGIAVSFCDPTERAFLRDIERLTRRSLTVVGGTPANSNERPAEGHKPGHRSGQKQGQRPGQKHGQKPGQKPAHKPAQGQGKAQDPRPNDGSKPMKFKNHKPQQGTETPTSDMQRQGRPRHQDQGRRAPGKRPVAA